MSANPKVNVPAYAPYGPFKSLIKDLGENGVPEHITTSVFKGSNSGKAMMKASFKYLALMDGDERPTSKLTQLTESDENYSSTLKQILLDSYPFLFDGSIDLANTTSERVADKFKDVGASGSTVSKCVAFFLSAAKDAEIQVHKRVKPPARPASPKKPKPNNGNSNPGAPAVDPPGETPTPEGMRRFEIALRDADDGVLFLPDDLEAEGAVKALKVITFLLEQYYDISMN